MSITRKLIPVLVAVVLIAGVGTAFGLSKAQAAYACEFANCTQTTEHTHTVCPLTDCADTAHHDHDGVFYYGHDLGDGHAYHNCGVVGCIEGGSHLHNSCGVSGCGLMENHDHNHGGAAGGDTSSGTNSSGGSNNGSNAHHSNGSHQCYNQ